MASCSHALNGDDAAACALFDEIRTAVNELDRLSSPQQECIEARLAEANAITVAPIGGQHRTVVDTLNLLFARLAENDRYRIGIQKPWFQAYQESPEVGLDRIG